MIQGSTVELSVGLSSDLPARLRPGWTSHLADRWRDLVNRKIYQWRATTAVRDWQMQVNAPEFLRLDRSEVTYQPWRGPFPSVALHLVTDQTGDYGGDLTVTLARRGYQTNTVLIPVRARVVAGPPRWSVLLTSTPFERYATGNGRELEPLTGLTSRLADRGVRVDFRDDVPKSLDGWNVVLVSDSALRTGEIRVGGGVHPGLEKDGMKRLHQFVARGGRLVVVASTIHERTVQVANVLLDPYGLGLGTREAGGVNLVATEIAADPLTEGVAGLTFSGTSFVAATDAAQAKLLAAGKEDSEIGFIAVSRAPDRGEVVVISQSLWWHWVTGESGEGDNAKMFENLLAP